MSPSFQILLMEPDSYLSEQITRSLQSKHYSVETVKSETAGLKRFYKDSFNLIICHEKLKDETGFRVFKKLENELDRKNIGFFLILDQYRKEEVQLGLELGIDNFVFIPINETSLRNKVDKYYKKTLEFNFYETTLFKEQFQESPIPMFFSEDFLITETNKAFSELMGHLETTESKFHFNDVFDMNGNTQNHLNLRKLENGLINNCWLDGVESVQHPKRKFNLYKSLIGNRDANRILTVLMPQYVNNKSDKCPVYGACLIGQDELPEMIHNDIHLTPRETEIFNLSANGVPLKQIASSLNLSQRTVEKHRSNIMQKTDTHSMMEAILKIRKNSASG